MTWFYIRSDGNGGIQIGKLLAAVLSIILFIGGIIVSAVAKDTRYQIDIENLKSDVDEAQDKISEHSETIATLTANIDDINSNVKFIKEIMVQRFGGTS